jgi:hypothetical protein
LAGLLLENFFHYLHVCTLLGSHSQCLRWTRCSSLVTLSLHTRAWLQSDKKVKAQMPMQNAAAQATTNLTPATLGSPSSHDHSARVDWTVARKMTTLETLLAL